LDGRTQLDVSKARSAEFQTTDFTTVGNAAQIKISSGLFDRP